MNEKKEQQDCPEAWLKFRNGMAKNELGWRKVSFDIILVRGGRHSNNMRAMLPPRPLKQDEARLEEIRWAPRSAEAATKHMGEVENSRKRGILMRVWCFLEAQTAPNVTMLYKHRQVYPYILYMYIFTLSYICMYIYTVHIYMRKYTYMQTHIRIPIHTRTHQLQESAGRHLLVAD